MAGISNLHCVFIEVEGHEDEVGDPARFGALGLARAATVTQFLVAALELRIKSLPSASQREVRISISTADPARPIRSNVTADGRALNRRVEIRTTVGPCGVIA
jgi:outer membrane protein OmpA-like peptidoglycan-associated protein